MAREYSESAGSPSDSPDRGEFRTHSLVLSEGAAGLRLDQALARALPQYSRARLQGWIEAGAVLVDGRRLRAKDKVLGGEQVEVAARLEADKRVAPEALPLAVVHQDRSLLVIDKPAGMVVHPGAGNSSRTLQNALLALDPKLALVPRAGLVHRLDKDTSGLLVVARTPEAHSRLVAALAEREIERIYLAICNGAMTGGGTVDAPIGRHRTQRTRMAVRNDGREAVTHYRIFKRYRDHTLLRVQLETGRTHQIRVHLAHIGYPIVGDPVYGGRRRLPKGCSAALTAALNAFPRQALHATRLALAHPMTGRALEWEAPLPDDMARLVSALDHDQRLAEPER
ncbi:MAG TPA: 23S rRNA pseudouridine(1911/1915/1917) synthase RluD [Steroidobacteraceae bacterium]|nr:23S rRNA pseudouridine(1911/1915/1917) synthase RluD [Steroidobacteraceae bacterium]